MFEKLKYRLNYFRKLIIETPYYGWIISLSLLAGVFNFLGLPALIPVLDYLQKGESQSALSPFLKTVEGVFLQWGIQPGFYSMLLSAGILILLGEMLITLSALIALYSSYRMITNYSKNVLELYTKADWRWLLSSNSGEVNYVVVKETELAAACHLNSQRIVISGIQCVAYFVLAVKMSLTAVLLATGVYTLLMLANMKNAHTIRRITDRFNALYKKMCATVAGLQQNKKFLKTSLLNSQLIKTINHQLAEISEFYRVVGTRTQAQYAANFATMFLFLITIILFYKPLGFNYSSLLILIVIFNRLAPQFNAFANSYAALNNYLPMHKALTKRINEMTARIEVSGTKKFDPDQSIRFEQVGFSYHAGHEILSDIDFVIKPHRTTAIVGRSGSGKTTVLDLLLGLLTPTQGAIYYGDITHEELDKNSLRNKLAYISQQPTMFDGTLKENLIIGCPQATEQMIEDVCRKTHIDQFIKTLPEGLNSYVGENGVKLSGGQKQRVVLARALLLNPSILILDEATSELDSETEKIIQETIRDLGNELTIILVAHRLSTVRQADQIFVLDQGAVCESGNYQELMERKGKLFFLDSLQK